MTGVLPGDTLVISMRYVIPTGGGGGDFHMHGTDSSEILNLIPKGDHLGVAQTFCDPQRRPIWAWLKQILTPNAVNKTS